MKVSDSTALTSTTTNNNSKRNNALFKFRFLNIKFTSTFKFTLL